MIHLTIVLMTVLALVLRVYEVTRPGLLLGVPQYDDAVYFGSALRLINGYAPYRDFVFLQPPGISLLLAPVAFIAKLTGTDVGLAVARVLTACVGAASVLLGGLLIRHTGLVAVIVACGILAIHPDAAGAAQTVFLEPWLVASVLAGALAAFSRGQLTTSTRRLTCAGVALAIACAIKTWAVVPLGVLLVLLVCAGGRRAAISFVSGLIPTLLVTVGPFVAAAPHAFVENVVVAQLSRGDISTTKAPDRINSLLGLTDLRLSDHIVIAVAIAAVLVVGGMSSTASVLGGRRPDSLEQFGVLSLAITFVMFMRAVDYYVHYAAFFALFLALTVSLPLARLLGWFVASVRSRQDSAHWAAAPGAVLASGAIVALAWGAVLVRQHEAVLRGPGPPLAVGRAIPRNSCVLTDWPAYTIAVSRFVSSPPGCSPIVDAIGMDYALAHGRTALTGAGTVPAARSAWLSAFRHAEYVWLSCGPPRAKMCDASTNRRIPWTAAIVAYFSRHFRRLTLVTPTVTHATSIPTPVVWKRTRG
ncbi:MAG: hypothetical protein JO304_05880 [Solirubrobacterales bacterium]|nr:hypothetical protein [Solirubrobacterales bacterium]